MFIILAERGTGKLHLITDNIVIAEQMTTVGVERETDLPVWYVGAPTMQTAKELADAMREKFGVQAQACKPKARSKGQAAFHVTVRDKGLRKVPVDQEEARIDAAADGVYGEDEGEGVQE